MPDGQSVESPLKKLTASSEGLFFTRAPQNREI